MYLMSKKRIALDLGSTITLRGTTWRVVALSSHDWFELYTNRHPRFGEAKLDVRYDDPDLCKAFGDLRVLSPQVVARYFAALEPHLDRWY